MGIKRILDLSGRIKMRGHIARQLPLVLKKHSTLAVLFIALLCTPLMGCAEKTVGEQFREIIAEIDAQCKKDKLGPYLDTNDPDYQSKRARTDCDILKIKPADPLATEEGRFAYSVKLPEPHDKLKAEYRKGMSAEAYFKELCEKDAGEWVFKTVEGVEGVFQGRRLEPYSPGYSNLVFFTRELSEITTEEPELGMIQPFAGRYNYFEIQSPRNKAIGKYTRFYRGEPTISKFGKDYPATKSGQMIRVPFIVHSEQANELKSRYGYTWRQVEDTSATEHGIAGSELIIFDLTKNEVLAFRRFFMRYWTRPDSRYLRLTNSDGCKNKFSVPEHKFIQQVLIPINPAE